MDHTTHFYNTPVFTAEWMATDDRSFYSRKIHTEDRDCIRCFARGNIKQRDLYLMSYT